MRDNDSVVSFDTESKDDRELFERGKEAGQTIRSRAHKIWDDYVVVGKAFVAAKNMILRNHGINTDSPTGRLGKAVAMDFHAWMKKYDLHDDFMNATDRAALFYCMEHLTGITEWREQLSSADYLHWNSPRTVWFHYQEYVEKKKEKEKKTIKTQQVYDENEGTFLERITAIESDPDMELDEKAHAMSVLGAEHDNVTLVRKKRERKKKEPLTTEDVIRNNPELVSKYYANRLKDLWSQIHDPELAAVLLKKELELTDTQAREFGAALSGTAPIVVYTSPPSKDRRRLAKIALALRAKLKASHSRIKELEVKTEEQQHIDGVFAVGLTALKDWFTTGKHYNPRNKWSNEAEFIARITKQYLAEKNGKGA